MVPDPGSVLFCRATQHTFLRLLTNASVLSPYGNPPLTNRQAWETYQALLADDRIAFRSEEPAGLEALWRRFAVRGTRLTQAVDGRLPGRLRVFAGGYRMVTTDAAFRQFGGLDVELIGERG